MVGKIICLVFYDGTGICLCVLRWNRDVFVLGGGIKGNAIQWRRSALKVSERCGITAISEHVA